MQKYYCQWTFAYVEGGLRVVSRWLKIVAQDAPSVK